MYYYIFARILFCSQNHAEYIFWKINVVTIDRFGDQNELFLGTIL